MIRRQGAFDVAERKLLSITSHARGVPNSAARNGMISLSMGTPLSRLRGALQWAIYAITGIRSSPPIVRALP